MKLMSTPWPLEIARPMLVPAPRPLSAQKTLAVLTAIPQSAATGDIFTYSNSTVEPFSGALST